MQNTDVQEYFKTSAGKELLKKHSLLEEGYWRIRGEDPNADFAGSHYQPELGIVQGKLEDVVAYAVALKGFYSWGAGGNIVKIPLIPKITAESNAERIRLEQEAAELAEKLAKINNQLNNL